MTCIKLVQINTSPDAKQCTFPPNAHHTCTNSDPCHYECDTNYVRNGDTCVCAPPNVSCNGVCGSFPKVSTLIAHIFTIYCCLALSLCRADFDTGLWVICACEKEGRASSYIRPGQSRLQTTRNRLRCFRRSWCLCFRMR